jgi:aerobic carbon-monoxide dehydrogenase medium subunit
MIPAAFEYSRAASLDEAVEILGNAGGSTKVIAGGQSLLPLMKLRLAQPERLLDIGRIGELRGVRQLQDGRIAIGALTTYAELLDSPVRHYGLLRDALPGIGDVQVRNRGTIGGNVCSSDPTNHLPPLLVAVGATFVVAGPQGERTVPAEDFFLGVYMTAAGPGELLTKITVPPGRNDGFSSVPIGVDGTCIVNAAASVNGGVRVALGCVGATPVLVEAESADAVRDAVRESAIDPPSDVHASADYRRHLAEVVAARAVEQAGRAG